MRYKPWGETRYTSGTTPTDLRYTGQREESALGLYFYKARWYDPMLGRFAQADTIVPNPGDARAWDRYAYARNAPKRYSKCTSLVIMYGIGGIGSRFEIPMPVIVVENAIGGEVTRPNWQKKRKSALLNFRTGIRSSLDNYAIIGISSKNGHW